MPTSRLLALLALPAVLGAQNVPVRYTIDADHSSIGFSVRFMGVTNVHGAFSQFGGTLLLDPADSLRSSVAVMIRAASINTNSELRDKDLKSPAFFDVEKYPLITFRSTKLERRGAGFVVSGPFSMHGITKDVNIPFAVMHQRTSDAWGNTRLGYAGALRVNRKDYGIQGVAFWNSEFDPGRFAVGDSVDIELVVEAEVPNYDKWTAPKADSLIAVIGTQSLSSALTQFRSQWTSAPDPARFPQTMWIMGGRKLDQHGMTADAIELYKVATELYPKSAVAHALLGEAYAKTGKRDLALRSFETAAGLDSMNTDATEWLRWLTKR